MPTKDSADDPTQGFNSLDDFAASRPDVSRDQAEAVWDFFRARRLSQKEKFRIWLEMEKISRQAKVKTRLIFWLAAGVVCLMLWHLNPTILTALLIFIVISWLIKQ